MPAPDYDITISDKGLVTLRARKNRKPVLQIEFTPEDLSRFVAELLRQEQQAFKQRPPAPQTMEMEREAVVETDGLGFARPPIPTEAIVTVRVGGSLLGFQLPIQTLGLTVDEFYRRTRRASGRAGPPEDPTRH